MIREICEKFTNLSESSIRKLEKISEGLPVLSELLETDIFIDCLVDSDRAIVVAEANPEHTSNYTKSVVGEYAYRKNEPAVIRTLETGHPSRDYKALTQESKYVTQNVVPIIDDENKKIIASLIVEEKMNGNQTNEIKFLTDTTKEILLNSLKMSQERKIINYVKDGIIIFNDKGICIYQNVKIKELFKEINYKTSILGEHFDNIVPDSIKFSDLVNKKEGWNTEIFIADKVLRLEYFFMKHEVKKNLVLFLKDITDIKIKEKELMLKSVAIKEIHHRIKNNLQTIASLLRMQARKAEDESVKKILNDSINRILSISITHEMLAQNGFDNLKIQEVIKKILRNSVRENINENLNLKISIEGDDFQINSDKATTIALIINELIENSVKHAFKNKKCGTIIVGIKNEGEKARISVVDNGIGMENRKIKKNSLGLQIVKSLVKDKLDGDLNIKSDNNGTNISFDVKLDQN